MVNKNKLNVAFRLMREAGLIAKQNIGCSQWCGRAEIGLLVDDLLEQDPRKKDQIKGCCYYDAQDRERLLEGEELCLSYGDIPTQKHGWIGLPKLKVGRIVVECCDKAGLVTQWPGLANSRIAVQST